MDYITNPLLPESLLWPQGPTQDHLGPSPGPQKAQHSQETSPADTNYSLQEKSTLHS